MLVGSFMSSHEIQAHLAGVLGTGNQYADWSLFPKEPSFRSYIALLIDSPEVFTMFWNSVKITGMVLLGQVFVGIPAAWGLARYRFPFRKVLFVLYVILMVMPFQVMMLAEYLTIKNWVYWIRLVGDPSGDFFRIYSIYCVCFVSENSGRSAGGCSD